MGWKCNVQGCRSGYAPLKHEDVFADQDSAKISFHKFPTDPDLRDEWLKNMQRENWEPLPNSHICSLHFKEEDFQIYSRDENKSRKKPLSWDGDKIKQRKLLPNAIPTIFSNLSSTPYSNMISVKRKHRKAKPKAFVDEDDSWEDSHEMETNELSSQVGFFTNGEEYPLPETSLKVFAPSIM